MPDYEADAARVFDCLKASGIAIVHMDVAYAIMSGTEDALRRVYAAKERSFDRPSGIVANQNTHSEIQIVDKLEKRLGKPVVTSVQATFWGTLRATGIDDRIDGCGRLLAEH